MLSAADSPTSVTRNRTAALGAQLGFPMERDFAPQFLRSNLVVLTNERSARPAEALAAILTARRFEKDRPLEAR
jgi:hypothetical protein